MIANLKTLALSQQELEEMKQRVGGWKKGGYITPPNLPSNLNAQLMITVASDVLLHGPEDLDRCIGEIERLSGENDRLRDETARIILLAEDHPSHDGVTYSVLFTKELLEELRSAIAR